VEFCATVKSQDGIEPTRLNLRSAEIATIARFFGGQGTINVNSWSPDSTRFAYVAYVARPAAANRP